MNFAIRVFLGVLILLIISGAAAEAIEGLEVTIQEDANGGVSLTITGQKEIKMDLDRDLIIYEKKDIPLAEDDIKKVMHGVEMRDAKAQYTRGLMYLAGRGGVSQSDLQAIELFRAAAEQGYGPGCNALGVMYLRGQGVPQHFVEAESWLQRASFGNSSAAFNLGYMRFWGLGRKPNNPVEPLLQAVKDQVGFAEFYLGLHYLRTGNSEKAYEWILRAVARNYDGIYASQAKSLRKTLGDKLGRREVDKVQNLAGWSYPQDRKPLSGVIGPNAEKAETTNFFVLDLPRSGVIGPSEK